MDDLDWIREGLKKPGKTQSGLAKALGRFPSAVTALLKGRRELKVSEVSKIADYLEVEPPAGLLPGSGPPSRPETRSDLTPANRAFGLARVDGTVQAGVFRRAEAFDDDLGETISAPRDPEFPFARQRAYRVAGDSMDAAKPKPIRDGDFIICAAFEDLGLDPQTGMVVVVERTLNDGQLRERSVKEVELRGEEVAFVPRSTNLAHEPIVMPRDLEAEDGTAVRILALVRFIFDNQPLPVASGGTATRRAT